MKLTTIEQLQQNLLEMYQQLREGVIEPKDAIEANNTAGKIIGVAKVQLAYHALRGEVPKIPFLAAQLEAPPTQLKVA